MTQSDVKFYFIEKQYDSIMKERRRKMDTFRVVIFLLSSFGVATSLVFLFLGVMVENLRTIIWKSLASLGIMMAVSTAVLWQDGGIVAARNISIEKSAENAPEVAAAYLPETELEQASLPVELTEENNLPETSPKAVDLLSTFNEEISPKDTMIEETNSSETLMDATSLPTETWQGAYQPEAPAEVENGTDGVMQETMLPVNDYETMSSTLQELQVHYIDVGQGDCTLITCGGQTMLIDAGDNSKGTAIWKYLYDRNITQIDYMIGTHPDTDHIGGMDVILTKFDCGTVIMPEIVNDTKTYQEVIETMDYWGYKNTPPVVGNTYILGDATFTIVAPNRNYGDINNFSIGILLVHGNNRFLFLGDAEEESEMDILQNGLDISAEVLKVAHHGSKTSTSWNLVNAVSPQYAVISCGENNSYGHPSAEVLNTLRAAGVSVYRTDEQGSIIAYSNGQNISFNCAPSESWMAGEPTGTTHENTGSYIENQVENSSVDNGGDNYTWGAEETQGTSDENTAPYVINKRSGIFHKRDCKSVKLMSESNKLFSAKTRDEIVAEGYDPCENCHP